jgi:hypothetical protein
MLSVAKKAPGSEGYYLDAVARGAEDYFGRGEAPGYWTGRGAELLGLDGEVSPDALRAVLASHAPNGTAYGSTPHWPPPGSCSKRSFATSSARRSGSGGEA